MADVKWIKVSTSMFESNRKIKQIENMPEGDTILVIWLKLLLLAGNVNDHGAIYITPEIPYTEEMLANELRRPLTMVRIALSVFESFGMIDIIDNVWYLSSWDKYQNTDKLAEMREYNRLAQQRSREKRKQISAVNDKSMTSQPCQDTEEEGEGDKDKEFHSFIRADEKEKRLELLKGTLGEGVVMMSEEQFNDLCDKLSLDEIDKYFAIIVECEMNGKRYKKKSHYQAILDMVEKDRRVAAGCG